MSSQRVHDAPATCAANGAEVSQRVLEGRCQGTEREPTEGRHKACPYRSGEGDGENIHVPSTGTRQVTRS